MNKDNNLDDIVSGESELIENISYEDIEEDIIKADNDQLNSYYKSLSKLSKEEEKKRLENYNKAIDEKPSFEKIFKQFSPLIALKGESYDVLKRISFYVVIANELKDKVFFRFERDQHDLRLPPMIIIRSGHGKKQFVNFIRNSVKGRNKLFIKPDSIHAEQLLGKSRVKEQNKRKKRDENDEDDIESDIIITEGLLCADFLIIDDALDIVTSIKSIDIRRYILASLDPIGTNSMFKKNVDANLSEAIDFQTSCTTSLLLQPPSTIHDSIFRGGLLRRFLIIYVDVPYNERKNVINDVTLFGEKINSDELMSKWIEKLGNIFENVNKGNKEKIIQIQATEEAKNKIKKYTKELLEMGHNRGGTCDAFARDATTTVEQHMCRMASIQSICRTSKIINGVDVDEAYKDLKMCWKVTLDLIGRVAPDSYNPEIKYNYNDQYILDNLPENNKKVNYTKFKEMIIKKLQISKKECEKSLRKLKLAGLIEYSPQKGKNKGSSWVIWKIMEK